MANDADHRLIERIERAWILFSLVLVLIFFGLVVYTVTSHGAHIARTVERQPLETILAEERFISPGVVSRDGNRYEISMLAQAFVFVPGEIELPVGAEATFHLASRDVIHGFQLTGTNVNIELIPGQVSTFRHTFDEPGDYHVICNQYCGIGHHKMQGVIRVVETAPAGGETEAAAEAPAAAPAAQPDWRTRGRSRFVQVCGACHRPDGTGMPGAFPPLVGHAPALVNAGGRDYLANLVLYGLQGAITVEGQTYNALMPPAAGLDDAQVADVLNYLLHAWGNDAQLADDFEPYTADEIAGLRGAGLDAGQVLEQRPSLDQ